MLNILQSYFKKKYYHSIILIFYVVFLLYARVKLDGFFPAWLRRLRHLLKLRLNDIQLKMMTTRNRPTR